MYLNDFCRRLLIVCLVLLPGSQAYAETAVDALKAELAELQKRYEMQGAQLHSLAEKIQQIEAGTEQGKTAATGEQPAADQQQKTAAPAAATGETPAQAPTSVARKEQPAPTTVATKDEEDGVKKHAEKSRAATDVADQAHALFGRRLTLETGLSYSRFDRKQLVLNGFLALDAIFLGTLSIDSIEADIFTLDFTGRYGVSDRLQFDLNSPFLYRKTTYASGGAGSSASALSEEEVTLDFELGDVNAGMYYQLFKEGPSNPDIVWNIRVKAPTGSDPYGIKLFTSANNDSLIVPSELPSGNGVWAVSSGFSFLKTLDPTIVFGNIGYTYNFEESFSDISSVSGTRTPGDIDLGDSIQFGMGMAFALNERMSLALSYSQRLVDESRTRAKSGPWTTIVSSDANVARFNVGLTYGITPRTSIITTLGVGLTPDAPDLALSMKLPYTF